MRSSLQWPVDIATIDPARILRGWTHRDLGRQAHVDEGTLCDLFARRRHPNFGMLTSLCAALGLSLREVVTFDAFP